ncbi:MAG: HEAT repeat domain-containing protein [Prosthecobacter sp.]
MKKTRHLILMLLACLPVSVSAQLPEEALQCFKWFSTLGYPDVKDAKWAEIGTGDYFVRGGKNQPEAVTMEGFVIRETDAEFTVAQPGLPSPGLPPETLRKSKDEDLPSYRRIRFEERPFLEMIRQQLESLRHPPKDGFERFGRRLGHQAEVFILSYICWQRGEQDLAAQLYAEAKKLPFRDPQMQEREVAMQECLEIQLGHAATWDAVLHIGGSGLRWSDSGGYSGKREPRTTLLESFRRIVRLFPRSFEVEQAKKYVAVLERMVQEDERHVKLTQEQINHLPLDQRITELIWMLRDQSGQQWGQPGGFDIFGFGDDGKTPAHQLLAIGYPAAPALIEALTDDRLSRGVACHRDFYFSHTVPTVGECAQDILYKVTGQSFHTSESNSIRASYEERMLSVQKAARKWWAEFQQKGKKQMLLDTLAAGQTYPGQLVGQLKAEAPEAVADALLRGAAKAQSPHVLSDFISQLGALKSPAATQQLLKLMRQDTHVEVRLDAAAQLLNEKHPEALPAILHEWSIMPSLPYRGPGSGFETLVNIMIASGDAQAMRQLAESKRLAHERAEIIQKLGDWIGHPTGVYRFTRVRAQPLSPEAKNTVLELLAHTLEDCGLKDGSSASTGDISFNNPRLCDLALQALHEIDGQYAFSQTAGRRQQEAERIAAANAWRAQHDQPLLPLPPQTKPPLREKDALKIVAVQIEPAKGFETTPFVRQAKELQGSTFGPRTISSLLVSFATAPIAGASGLRIEALRENDLSGVELHLRIEPGDYPQGDSKRWSMFRNGQLGRLPHGGQISGQCSLSEAKEEEFWTRFDKNVDVASVLALPPRTAFSFYAGLRVPRPQ